MIWDIIRKLMSLKSIIRPVYRKFWVLPRIHRTYKRLSAAETFSRIYASGAWGDGSGSGSRGRAAAEYCDYVCSFIKSHNIGSVADLGCGDFHVGREIIRRTGVQYTGVDIVPSLIEKHAKEFPGVSFVCANLISDPLPSADLCLVRQVLQHLSNEEVESVLLNIASFPLALISEHVPVAPKSFNRNKPHGPDVRTYWRSGVYVDKPPFSRVISDLWEVEIAPGELLRTVLISTRH